VASVFPCVTSLLVPLTGIAAACGSAPGNGAQIAPRILLSRPG